MSFLAFVPVFMMPCAIDLVPSLLVEPSWIRAKIAFRVPECDLGKKGVPRLFWQCKNTYLEGFAFCRSCRLSNYLTPNHAEKCIRIIMLLGAVARA